MSQHSYSASLLANELESLLGSDMTCHWQGDSVEEDRKEKKAGGGKQTLVNTLISQSVHKEEIKHTGSS